MSSRPDSVECKGVVSGTQGRSRREATLRLYNSCVSRQADRLEITEQQNKVGPRWTIIIHLPACESVTVAKASEERKLERAAAVRTQS